MLPSQGSGLSVFRPVCSMLATDFSKSRAIGLVQVHQILLAHYRVDDELHSIVRHQITGGLKVRAPLLRQNVCDFEETSDTQGFDHTGRRISRVDALSTRPFQIASGEGGNRMHLAHRKQGGRP